MLCGLLERNIKGVEMSRLTDLIEYRIHRDTKICIGNRRFKLLSLADLLADEDSLPEHRQHLLNQSIKLEICLRILSY